MTDNKETHKKCHLYISADDNFNVAAFSKITNKAWYFMRISYLIFVGNWEKNVAKFVVCCIRDWRLNDYNKAVMNSQMFQRKKMLCQFYLV